MDLNELLVFTRVVQAGSFTGAARSLGLPKSTVSRKVSQLEERLGARLLHRTTRRLNLTEAGSAYYEHCTRAVGEVEAAEQAVQALQEAPRGKLRVTAPVGMGTTFLGVIVADLLRRYPEMELDLLITDRLVDMVDEGFDLAIRAGDLDDSALIARRVGEVPRYVCASPEYLARRGVPQVPEDLRSHDCIVFRFAPGTMMWRLGSQSGPIDVPVKGRMSVNSFDVVREAAIQGLGLGILPAHRCVEDFKAGRLTPVLQDHNPPTAVLHAVYPTTRHMSPVLKVFLETVTTELRASPWANFATRSAVALNGSTSGTTVTA